MQSTFPSAVAEFVNSKFLRNATGSDSVAFVQCTMMTGIEAGYFSCLDSQLVRFGRDRRV